MSRYEVSVSAECHWRIQREARRRGVTMSQVVDEAAALGVEPPMDSPGADGRRRRPRIGKGE